MKTFKLTSEQKKQRLQSSVCPACGDHLIVKQHRVYTTFDEVNGSEKKHYGGWYYVCSGPNAHRCYTLSGDGLSETFGDCAIGVNIRKPSEKSEKTSQRVIKRKRAS